MEIAKSYDSMPYPTKFFGQTHPDRLATLATVFGIPAKLPNESRVLELGCGNGSNLVSHAYNLQDSTFVGVDISGKHIDVANKSAEQLNLSNIEFRKIDVMDMKLADFGKFDYITAHGLISWIPDFVREKVFTVFSEMLTPNGIGYASYNAYPGSHYRDMVRNVMKFHTHDEKNPLKKVEKSLSFLSLLADNSNETKIYQPILDFEHKRHLRHEPSDIYHDDLSEFYRPFYFHEFAEILAENNLQFLCETELHAMSIQNFPPEVQKFINDFENVVEREQYIDFFLGRIFRQTLFCSTDIEIDRSLKAEVIEKFSIASEIAPASDDMKIGVVKAERFVGSKGFGIEIDHPPTKAALKILGERWAEPIKTKALLQEARQLLEQTEYSAEDWQNELETTRTILFHIYRGTDLLELHLHHPIVNRSISKTPKLNELSRWQIDRCNNVTSLFYINIGIEDEVARCLLRLLDGTRDNEQLLSDVRTFIETDAEITDKKELLDDIENWLNNSLNKLASLGMFVS